MASGGARRGRRQGVLEGRRQGMCEGMSHERALLRRLAARRSCCPQMQTQTTQTASSCNCPPIRVCSSQPRGVLEGGIQVAKDKERRYEADGTVHVRYGSGGKAKSVTFIPRQYVEQRGSKFVVFVPSKSQECSCKTGKCQEGSCKIGLTVKVSGCGAAKGVKLVCAAKFGDALLHAAARGTNVTVVVSCSNGNLALRGIVVPAVPKPAT